MNEAFPNYNFISGKFFQKSKQSSETIPFRAAVAKTKTVVFIERKALFFGVFFAKNRMLKKFNIKLDIG